MPGLGDWNLGAGRDTEVQMFAGWKAGKERAQRPVRHKGESKRRNGDAGQEKGGEKGNSRGGINASRKECRRKEGPDRGQNLCGASGIPA